MAASRAPNPAAIPPAAAATPPTVVSCWSPNSMPSTSLTSSASIATSSFSRNETPPVGVGWSSVPEGTNSSTLLASSSPTVSTDSVSVGVSSSKSNINSSDSSSNATDSAVSSGSAISVDSAEEPRSGETLFKSDESSSSSSSKSRKASSSSSSVSS